MFAQDLSNVNPTILVRIDIRSIEYHKYSLFSIQYSFTASLAWDFRIDFPVLPAHRSFYKACVLRPGLAESQASAGLSTCLFQKMG